MRSGAVPDDDLEQMLRRLVTAATFLTLVLPGSGAAAQAGADVTFEGGSAREQGQVRAALAASSFDWRVVPQQVTVHIGPYGTSQATPGHVWLDAGLLRSGRFAWATVMDEFAHQVDFFLLDGPRRQVLQERLGAQAWCYEVPGLNHAAHGCERFSSMVAWAYWPSRENAYRPRSRTDEAASMPASEFRSLLAELIGVPGSVANR
jgi:hypothetical protein